MSDLDLAVAQRGRKLSTNHLAPMLVACPCEEIGGKLSIRVIFSNHCYTERYDPDRHDVGQIYRRDSSGPRVFCPIRHKLSFRLPAIVGELMRQKVHQTAHRNYVYAVSLNVEGQHYEVFLTLQRDSTAGVDLRMTIQSAYVVDRPWPQQRAVRFKLLAYKILRGQPIKFAPR
jgi:hypothetical protein